MPEKKTQNTGPEGPTQGREASNLIEQSPRDNGAEAGNSQYPGTPDRNSPDKGAGVESRPVHSKNDDRQRKKP